MLVPPEYGVRLPQPDELPDQIARDVRSFREHPAGRYALELFRTERRVVVGAHAGPHVVAPISSPSWRDCATSVPSADQSSPSSSKKPSRT